MSEICHLLTVSRNKFRIENIEGDMEFNKTCINNRIYPVPVKYITYIFRINTYQYTYII